jgi:hypothetical protein
MSTITSEKITQLQQRITQLTQQLEQARLVVKHWTDTSAQLSLNAADARAKNQGLGRGLGGALLGSKYRSVMRSAAANSNASISKEVAQKRAKIAAEKSRAQEVVRRIQEELKASKEQYRIITSNERAHLKEKSAAVKRSTESIDLLQKLKEAHDLGLLTDEEFELKRKKLVDNV